MFSLSIAVGPIQWRLLFKTEDAARTAEMRVSSPPEVGNFFLDDDFGQRIAIMQNSMTGWMFEDLDKSKLAHIELALHQARMQDSATKAAQTDPQLRASAQMRGPSVINPMGNGGFPRQM